MSKTWIAGKDRKVVRWVDERRVEARNRWVAVGIVFTVVLMLLVVWVFGVAWGRMGRDCDFMAQTESWESVPSYCKTGLNRLHVM